MPTGIRVHFWPVVLLLALAAASKPVLYDTLDPDSFWHLRVAGQLSSEGIGPLVDQLSFASSKTPWTPYSWLAELGMKWTWDTMGWRGAVALNALLNGIFVLLVALACQLSAFRGTVGTAADESRSDTPALLFPVVLATFLSLPYLSFRPASFAIVLLAGAMCLMQYHALKPNQWSRLAPLVPVTALLANIHLFASLVPLWLAAKCAGSFPVGTRAAPTPPTLSPSKPGRLHAAIWRPLFTFFLLTLLATCATPMLPGVVRTMVHYQFHDPMVASPFLAEMQPFYRGPMGSISGGLVLWGGLALLRHRHHLNAGDIALLLLGSGLLMLKGRYAPLFAITTAPILAHTLSIGRRRQSALADHSTGNLTVARPHPFATILGRVLVPMLALLFVIRLILAFPNATDSLDAFVNRHGVDAPGYPAAAANFVHRRIVPRTGRLINEFTWGGYLAWRLPAFQTLMDGRTQCFTPDFWSTTCLGSPQSRLEFLARCDADVAILPATNSLLARPLQQLGWRPVYRDERTQVLVPTKSEQVVDTAAP